MKFFHIPIIAILFLILGIVSGLFFLRLKNALCENKFKFINSAIVCGKQDVIAKTSYNETRTKLLNFIKEKKGSEIAVYFRDLVHGPVFSINELTPFIPASLLKLPLALVFMNSAETEPELLGYKIRYEGQTSVGGQIFKPIKSAEPNKDYTIEELLKLMLIHSDNASYEVLAEFLFKLPQRLELRRRVYQELGFIDPQNRTENTIGVSGYASLFRILHNVSYLDAEGSEKILGWLSESDFDQGIKAGVPISTEVSHKFGERFLENNQVQLHDCGIVYYPGNPYIICIMTRGNNYEELIDTIKQISKMIHEEVDSRRL